jgi:poly(3-hydroxybutyrate) depolymerase
LVKGDDASAEAHRKFYDEYNAVLDMDAKYYIDTIRVVFQEFNLVKGTWDVKGVDGKIERVHPEDIKTTALLSVEGELDDISGSGQTAAVHDICSGVESANQQHLEVPGAGHYGIFAGSRWREVVYPKVKAFIQNYQPKKVATPAALPAAKTAPVAVVAPKAPPQALVVSAPAAKAEVRTVAKAAKGSSAAKAAAPAAVVPDVVAPVAVAPAPMATPVTKPAVAPVTASVAAPAQAKAAPETHWATPLKVAAPAVSKPVAQAKATPVAAKKKPAPSKKA